MSIFEVAIGWLAPSECAICAAEGSALCELCRAAEVLPYGQHCGFCGQVSMEAKTCKSCKAKGAPTHIWISTDYQGAAKDILRAYKFRHQRAVGRSLAAVVAETFWAFNDQKSFAKANYLIVPVPTASSRIRQRGFDHSALLAKQLGGLLKLPSYPGLTRQGQVRQVGSKRSVRLVQQIGNYRVPRPDKIAGRNILLIDDVVTTGGTLRAAYKALRAAGAKRVDALAFAKRI